MYLWQAPASVITAPGTCLQGFGAAFHGAHQLLYQCQSHNPVYASYSESAAEMTASLCSVGIAMTLDYSVCSEGSVLLATVSKRYLKSDSILHLGWLAYTICSGCAGLALPVCHNVKRLKRLLAAEI